MKIMYYITITESNGRDILHVNNVCQVIAFNTQADANIEAINLLKKFPNHKLYILKKMGEMYNGPIHDEIRERDVTR